jgi:hypothetical protein
MVDRYCRDERAEKECLSFQMKKSNTDTLEERHDWSDLLYSSIYYIENF